MSARKQSLTKEIQELLKKINAIFQVLTLDDRVDDFQFEKRKEMEYEITKALAVLEVQLNQQIVAYAALKDPHAMKRLKKAERASSREKVRPVALIKSGTQNIESVVPVDVDQVRRERFNAPATKKTESGHLVGISSQSKSVDPTDESR